MKIVKNIDIDWIRHGFSCANMLYQLSPNMNLSKLAPNPVLSNYGIQQAKDTANSILKDYDAILCSNLTRALETALFMFDDKKIRRKIIIVPYVSEKMGFWDKIRGIDLENKPGTLDDLLKSFDKLNRVYDFNIDVDASVIKYFEELNVDLSPDYDKFVKEILPIIFSKIKKENRDKSDYYKIAIVSHSNFI